MPECGASYKELSPTEQTDPYSSMLCLLKEQRRHYLCGKHTMCSPLFIFLTFTASFIHLWYFLFVVVVIVVDCDLCHNNI